MDWRSGRRSDNVEDGGSGGGGGIGIGRLGLGGTAAVVVISLLLGQNPLQMLGLVNSVVGGGTPTQQGPVQQSAENTQNRDFVAAILGETEDVWGEIFTASNAQYERPKLVLFPGRVQTACGGATSASGPFYCPADRKVYLDTAFFDEMRARLGGGGEFAQAYVIAHEVGHHVQNLTGISEKVTEARRAGQNIEGNDGLSVRQELQADCYAGVWANRAEQRHHWLQAGDIEQALTTATAIGDDRLQQQSRGEVVPDSFTHGTSEERVRWFKRGFETGAVGQCDTFKAVKL